MRNAVGKKRFNLFGMKMSIQKIMVPLDPSEYAKAATIRACKIAKIHGASLTGLTVLDTPGIRADQSPVDPYIRELIEEGVRHALVDARKQIAEVRENFVQTCDREGVTHVDPQLEGVPASTILDAAGLHDLIVIGLRTFFHFETTTKPGDSLSKLLRRTATPILAVPLESPGEPFEQILICYDGSLNSARTIREFVGFAAPFNWKITLLTAEKDEKQALWLLDEASSYLRAHGIEKLETIHSKQSAVPDEVLEDADLIVAGIHSRRFLADRFVGSLTNKLIERNDTALFLSH
jgi:nucleotide-binding universal stress UspA family protein